MARDHRKLRVFGDAHQLTLAIYKRTKRFPKDEWFGLRAQIRRAAVSLATNIVEGSARLTTREYLNFLNVARSSGAEVAYLVDLTTITAPRTSSALSRSVARTGSSRAVWRARRAALLYSIVQSCKLADVPPFE
jgi:four helix bundle protein